MALYHEDIVDINLESGTIHRSFLNHSIGRADVNANRFGIRTFRDGVPVDLSGASCQGFFRNAEGTNIALTSYGTVDGNVAYVTLPAACYNVEGQFCLSIKLVGGGVTGTMRIVDGMVDNTNTTGAVAPTSSVPTYSEIIAQYDAMVAATAAANGCTAETFDATKAYSAGKYVINSGALYRLTADHAANTTWANTSKVEVKFGDELTDLKSALNYKESEKSGQNYNGYLFNVSGGELIDVGNTAYNCTKYDIDPDRIYYLTSSIRAGDPYYPLIVYLDASENVIGYQWLNSLDQVYSVTHTRITIPSGTKYCYVNALNNPGVIYWECTTVDNLEKEVDIIENTIEYRESTKQGQHFSGYLYNVSAEKLLNVGNTAYDCTKFKIDENREYYLTASIRAGDPYYPLIVYIAEDGDVIGYQWLNEQDQTYSVTHEKITIPSGTKYCYVNALNNPGVLNYECTSIDDMQEEIDELKNNRFYVGSDLTGYNTFQTIRMASDYIKFNDIHDATIFVTAGEYDLVSELSNAIGSSYDGNRYTHGIQFGFETHWIFAEGACLKFNYDGSNTNVANLFSPLVICGSCIIENMNIEVGNCQYCVHDDWTERESNWIVEYRNCTMKHNGNTVGTYTDTVCIGGGLLPEELVIIDGGKYQCPVSFNYPISYHSIWSNLPESHPSKIIFKNIWLSGGIRLQDAPWNCNIVEAIITNCSQGADVGGTHTFFDIAGWNNIIRN